MSYAVSRSALKHILRVTELVVKADEGLPVGVVGGFAYALKDIFSRIAAEEGIALSCILKAPVEGLVKYHNSMIEPSS